MMKTFVAAQRRVMDLKDRLNDVRNDESGAALVEYALLVGLMAVAAAGAITALSGNLQTAFQHIGSHLTSIN
jgi:pilus assembly protein Flp/PilA